MISSILFAIGYSGMLSIIGTVLLAIITLGTLIVVIRCYHRVEQGQALVRNGVGGTKVSFSGMVVFPVIHKIEYMDISVHRIQIDRREKSGLICKDNMRADITVAFFVRVNKNADDVLKVAQTIGCKRASDAAAITELFDPKFSEALKTAGRRFDFVELYNSRQNFRAEIVQIIGTDLNGYVLEDAAIDYLEQTKKEYLDPDNILDSEGIKKITNLTAEQAKLANQITREKEQAIKKQDVETAEAILEMERQLAEATQKQKREVAVITSRETSEARKVEQEQRLIAERARIQTEEEIQIAEENKQRQIIVAAKNRERTSRIETQKVEQDELLAINDRDRVVALAQIEKTKIVETEKKNIQDVIRERVAVEKTVEQENQNIKDITEIRTAERSKKVAIIAAEKEAEQNVTKEIKKAEADKRSTEIHAEANIVRTVKAAEAEKKAAEIISQKIIIEASAHRDAAERDANAKKLMAEAVIAETAAPGLGEAQVISARADALRKQGEVEAGVLELKYKSEASGIHEKALAMKEFHEAGREHEEFKLRLNKDRDVDLAAIAAQKDIVSNQALVVSEALKNAKIDIVGGDTVFFNRIVEAASSGKALEAIVKTSPTLTQLKDSLLGGNGEFVSRMRQLIGQLGISSEDLKNLTVAAALTLMMSRSTSQETGQLIQKVKELAEKAGFMNEQVSRLS